MENLKSASVSTRTTGPSKVGYPHSACRKEERSSRSRLPVSLCSTALVGLLSFHVVSRPASAQTIIYGSTESVEDNANAGIIGRPSVASGTISIVGPTLDTITYIRDSDDVIIGIVDDGHYDRSVFINGSSAGSAQFNISGEPYFLEGASVSFYDTSNAGNATINNNGIGEVIFYDSSSASSSVIKDGNIIFADRSTAGGATLSGHISFQNNSTADHAAISIVDKDDGGLVGFSGSSTAGSATISSDGGDVQFSDASTADSAVITNHGGLIFFMDTSTASLSTIDNDGGSTIFGNILATRNGAGDYGYFGGDDDGGVSSVNDAQSTADRVTITNRNGGYTQFQGATTANDATITNDGGNTGFGGTSSANNAIITNINGGVAGFFGNSSAENAVIHNSDGGSVQFFHNSTAKDAAITNASGGNVLFSDSSTAENANIGNDAGFVNFGGSSTARNAVITNSNGGGTSFNEASIADGATITNDNGYTVFGSSVLVGNVAVTNIHGGYALFSGAGSADAVTLNNDGGNTQFFNESTAGAATITNTHGGALSFGFTSTAGDATIVNDGGFTIFGDSSTGGNASITNSNGGYTVFGAVGPLGLAGVPVAPDSNAGNAIINNGMQGATYFVGQGDAGTATLSNIASTGVFDFSGTTGRNGNGEISAGSIKGGGTFYLGSNQLSLNDNGRTSTVSGVISDGGDQGGVGGGLLLNGSGSMWIFTGANTYTGTTAINAGTLQLGNGGTTGSIMGDVVDNGILTFNRSDMVTFGGAISGSGKVNQNGAGTLILTGDSTYIGGTTITAGTVQLGNGGASGGIMGDVVNSGTLAFERSDTLTFGGAISGSGGVSQNGSGTTILTGANEYTGATRIDGGELRIDGAIDSSGGGVVVNDAATLSGRGSIKGDVVINAGGILAGTAEETLTMGALTLDARSSVNVTLDAPSATALFKVNGNLVLDGTLNVSGTGNFGDGLYRLIDFSGSLTNKGLDIGAVSNGYTQSNLEVQTSLSKQVNLVVSSIPDGNTDEEPPVSSGPKTFWDGAHVTANGIVDGGRGTWSVGGTNWTDTKGTTNGAYDRNAMLIFAGAADIVDVNGPLTLGQGLQFAEDGYLVQGNGLILEGATTVRVGDGTAEGADMTATIASALDGSGSLTKTDLGTLVLSGQNSYAGATTIDDGTLVIAAGGSIISNVTNHATFVIAGTVTGDLVNDGQVTIDAGGLLNAPTGIVNSAGSLIVNNSTIVDDLDNAGTVTNTSQYSANVHSNTGTINNAAGATWTGDFNTAGVVNNDGTIDGSFTQTDGATINNGVITGSIEVSGGTLTGTGSVGGLIVNDGAVLNPGVDDGIGTINVAGGLGFSTGSIYRVAVNAAGQSSQVNAAGTIEIEGGTVDVRAGDGKYAPSTRYTILGTTLENGRTGEFASVTSNLAFLDPTLDYDAGHVYLTLTRNSADFADVGVSDNQRATGAAVESLGFGNSLWDAMVQLDADTARSALDQLSGEFHASVKTGLIEDSHFMRDAAIDRLLVPGKGGALWGHAFGSWGRTKGTGGTAELRRSTGGLFIGVDRVVSETLRVGVLGGYSHTGFSRAHGSGDSDNYHLGAYAGGKWGGLALRAGIAHSWHDLKTTRSIAFTGFEDNLRSDYKAGTTQLFGEMGYSLTNRGITVEPFANLAYVALHTDGFAERGGDGALTARSQNSDIVFSTLGVRGSANVGMNGIKTTAVLGWRHAFGDETPDATMAFAAGANVFTITGAPIIRNAAILELKLGMAIGERASLDLSYNGQLGSRFSDHGVRSALRIWF